jgi:hypothetical protein
VISTGPYAHMRHPMYAMALVMMAGIPIALGSGWGLLALAAMLPALLWRIVDEETFLVANLPGYAAYKQRVRYRPDAVRLVAQRLRDADTLPISAVANLTKEAAAASAARARFAKPVAPAS